MVSVKACSSVFFVYAASGRLTKDLNKKISGIQYNYLHLPKQVDFTDGRKIEYVYDASGVKLQTKHTKPGESPTTTDYFANRISEDGVLKMIRTEEGYAVPNGSNGFNRYYYIKDHLGNNRVVMNENGGVEQVTNYYPFGTTFAENPARTDQDVQRFKFGGKELDRMFGLDMYDFEARMYSPVLGRFMQPDPMAEKYYSVSPYAYCGNNPVNRIDPDGRDWYQNNETKYYTWYKGDEQREGYTHIGNKGSVLGEFESIIDGILTDPDGLNARSLYSEGFTFDIAPNDKGGLIGSKERDWDFLDEFVNGVGPEFSVLLSDHPYTEAMKTDKTVSDWQQRIADGETTTPGQVTGVRRKWTPLNVFGTTSKAKQFIGSYRYDAFTSSDGKTLNNVISDSKSRTSLFLHLPFTNQSRSQTRAFSNTYQFYIWKSSK